MQALGGVTKAQITAGFALVRKFANGARAALAAGMQIQPRAVAPGMARKNLRRLRLDMFIQTAAGSLEHLVKYMAHGQYGGAGIDGLTADAHAAQLAAGFGLALQYQHRQAATGQADGRTETANAGTDDDDRELCFCHLAVSLRPCRERSINEHLVDITK